MDGRFRDAPRPEDEVVAQIERALRAAKSGRVRSAAIVLVTHQQVEHIVAGELRPQRIDSLIAGLNRALHELLTPPSGQDDPSPKRRF
jgi:hypothetical protein